MFVFLWIVVLEMWLKIRGNWDVRMMWVGKLDVGYIVGSCLVNCEFYGKEINLIGVREDELGCLN